jgi:tRNA A-37 threonylcarbamoyl transferase component Bud32
MSRMSSSSVGDGGGDAHGLLRERHGAFVVWRQDSAEARNLLARLLPDPDRLLTAGEHLPSPWCCTTTDKVRIIVDSQPYFLKRYNCGGWLYRFKNAFRPSRALRSWRAAEHFAERGVPTPKPLLCLEVRHLRLLGRSYILFPFLSGAAGSFLDLWPSLDEVQKRECLQQLGVVIGRMHGQGLLHGDLNWRNILAVRSGLEFRFHVVDLDGSRHTAKMIPDDAIRDLDHFLRDLERSGADPDLRAVFLDRWRREVPFVASQSLCLKE